MNLSNNSATNLPLLSINENDKLLRNKLYELGIDNQIVIKNMLQNASDNIRNNTKEYKEYLKKNYEEKKLQDSSFEYDESNLTSSTFDTISSHISNLLEESSNSSIFERADKIKIMKYIDTAINNADIDNKEKKQLIEQYKYASNTLKKSSGIYDKATALFVRNIGNITGLFSSIFSDLPPITTFLLTRGGDYISKKIEQNRTKKERLASLEYDINKNENEVADINHKAKRPSLLDSNNNNNKNEINNTETIKNNQSLLTTIVNNESSAKLERINNTTGSLLDKAPIGTTTDPFFVVIKNGISKEEKDNSNKGIMSNILSMIPNIFSKFGKIFSILSILTGKFSKVISVIVNFAQKFGKIFSSLISTIGIKNTLEKATGISTTDKDLVSDDKDKNNTSEKSKKEKKSKKRNKRNKSKLNKTKTTFAKDIKSLEKPKVQLPKKSLFSRLTSGVSKIGGKALSYGARLGSKLLGPIGVALTAADVLSFLNSAVSEKLEEAKEQGVKINDSIASSTSSDDAMNNAIEMSRRLSEKSKLKKEESSDNGIIKQSKDLPRDVLNNQINNASKAREQLRQEKSSMQLTSQQTNNTNMINTINQNTTQNTNRVIQVTNPQAGLVNGSR